MLYPAPQLEFPIAKDAFKVSLPVVRSGAKVTFLLNAHGSVEDFPLSMREDFEEADIVLHELIGWQQESVDLLDRHARGVDEPVYQDPYGINERKKQLLLGTHVKNGIWDVPEGHLSLPEFAPFFTGGASDEEIIRLTVKRDRLALRTIGKRIDSIAGVETNSPRVLVNAGLAHVALANAFIAHEPTAQIRVPRPDLDPPEIVIKTISYLAQL